MKGGRGRRRAGLPVVPPATLKSPTRFGQLLEVLARRRFPPTASTGGGRVLFLHGFPIEEAVSHGLMMVVLEIARKEGRPVETPDDVLRIAKRVDLLVDAGLSVGFSGVESAADAFVRNVVEPVHRAALAGFRPSDPPSAAAWKEIAAGKLSGAPKRVASHRGEPASEAGPFLGRPAALFFVRLLNGAARFRARIEARLDALERENRIDARTTWIPDSDFDSVRRAVRALGGRTVAGRTGGVGVSRVPHARRWGSWLEASSELERCARAIAWRRALPVRLPPRSGAVAATSVLEGWVPTLALAAVGRFRKEADVLTPAEFWKAVSRIGEAFAEGSGRRGVADRVVRSIRTRAPGIGVEDLSALSAEVREALDRMEHAAEAWRELLPSLESIERKSREAEERIREIDARLRKSKRDRGALLEEREEAEERLARLQEEHDRLKTEFQSLHFPALFLEVGAAGVRKRPDGFRP